MSLVVLTLVFIAMKLSGVVAWSWWWVTAPLWVPYAALLSVIVSFIILAFAFGVTLES